MSRPTPGTGVGSADERVERLSQSVWRVALPVHTLPPHDHTNAYLIADSGFAMIVDPGSAESEALGLLEATMRRAQATRLSHVVITHSHPDHVDGVGPLLARMDEPAVGVHELEAGRLPPEWPRLLLSEGDSLRVGEVSVRCLHTPGHSPGHLTLVVEERGEPTVALAGDLVAAEGSVWVGLPDGDMARYLASLERVAASGAGMVGAGHGPAIRRVAERLSEMAEHRLDRERQVLAALDGARLTARQITEKVYPPLPQPVLELALKSVEAHLLKLVGEGRVARAGHSDEPGEPRFALP